jgi:hypothetical protein
MEYKSEPLFKQLSYNTHNESQLELPINNDYHHNDYHHNESHNKNYNDCNKHYDNEYNLECNKLVKDINDIKEINIEKAFDIVLDGDITEKVYSKLDPIFYIIKYYDSKKNGINLSYDLILKRTLDPPKYDFMNNYYDIHKYGKVYYGLDSETLYLSYQYLDSDEFKDLLKRTFTGDAIVLMTMESLIKESDKELLEMIKLNQTFKSIIELFDKTSKNEDERDDIRDMIMKLMI